MTCNDRPHLVLREGEVQRARVVVGHDGFAQCEVTLSDGHMLVVNHVSIEENDIATPNGVYYLDTHDDLNVKPYLSFDNTGDMLHSECASLSECDSYCEDMTKHAEGHRVDSTVSSDSSCEVSSQTEEHEVDRGDGTHCSNNCVVLAMLGTGDDIQDYMRDTIVTLDAIPKTLVEGISPLYQVLTTDGTPLLTAVVQIRSTLSLEALMDEVKRFSGVKTSSSFVTVPVACNAKSIMVTCTSTAISLASSSLSDDSYLLDDAAREFLTSMDLPIPLTTTAAVLSPWMDMDMQAQIDGDPVSYRLALTQDAYRVVMLSDRWIMG